MSSAPDFRISAISHIMLGVAQLPTSLEFYRDKLGLRVAFESPGFAFLQAGGVTLCLSEPLSKVSEEVVGAVEVVFGVDDVQQAHAALVARGVRFSHAPRQVTPNEWAANFADPDGHRLAVFGPASAALSS
jgi:catechol 2,3-dioxygenase-like lactoylglutathione lyase family enzyme